MQHARKVALDEVAYENGARGVKRDQKYQVSAVTMKVQWVTEL